MYSLHVTRITSTVMTTQVQGTSKLFYTLWAIVTQQWSHKL